jgi:hypothetical protein
MRAPLRAAVRPSVIVLLSAALMGAAGCGPSVWKPPAESFRAYPARAQKVDLRVALRLTPELRASKWEKKDCCVMEVGLEWRLVRADRRPVWVDTIGGQATGSTGGSAEKPLKAAVEDLFLKSERAMTESRAVLYAANKR